MLPSIISQMVSGTDSRRARVTMFGRLITSAASTELRRGGG
jgi:hypothetical protein